MFEKNFDASSRLRDQDLANYDEAIKYIVGKMGSLSQISEGIRMIKVNGHVITAMKKTNQRLYETM